MPAINERFKAVRKKLEITQTEFGKKLGLQQGSVGDIERSKDNIGVSESVKRLLESEYDVNLIWLETGDGDMFKPKKSATTKAQTISPGKELNEIKRLLKENEELKVYKEKYIELQERYVKLLEKVNSLKK